MLGINQLETSVLTEQQHSRTRTRHEGGNAYKIHVIGVYEAASTTASLNPGSSSHRSDTDTEIHGSYSITPSKMSTPASKTSSDVPADVATGLIEQYIGLAIARGSSKERVPILNREGKLVRHVDRETFRPGNDSDASPKDPARLVPIRGKDGELKGYVDALALRRGGVSVASTADYEKLRLIIDREFQARYEEEEALLTKG